MEDAGPDPGVVTEFLLTEPLQGKNRCFELQAAYVASCLYRTPASPDCSVAADSTPPPQGCIRPDGEVEWRCLMTCGFLTLYCGDTHHVKSLRDC